jgi:hypothetical protein
LRACVRPAAKATQRVSCPCVDPTWWSPTRATHHPARLGEPPTTVPAPAPAGHPQARLCPVWVVYPLSRVCKNRAGPPRGRTAQPPTATTLHPRAPQQRLGRFRACEAPPSSWHSPERNGASAGPGDPTPGRVPCESRIFFGEGAALGKPRVTFVEGVSLYNTTMVGLPYRGEALRNENHHDVARLGPRGSGLPASGPRGSLAISVVKGVPSATCGGAIWGRAKTG